MTSVKFWLAIGIPGIRWLLSVAALFAVEPKAIPGAAGSDVRICSPRTEAVGPVLQTSRVATVSGRVSASMKAGTP